MKKLKLCRKKLHFYTSISKKRRGCPECEKMRVAKWNFLNADKVKEDARIRRKLNPDKVKKDNLKWATANPEKSKLSIRRSKLMKTHGITIEAYDEMVLNQKNVCAICTKPETLVISNTGAIARLSVDHCHKTGKIRGLLCGACNKAIGLLKDDVEVIVKAASYVALQGV